MGKFSETAFMDYRLLFAAQGKQTSVSRFRLQRTKGRLLFSASSKLTEVAIFH
jgi:hypothetical protein